MNSAIFAPRPQANVKNVCFIKTCKSRTQDDDGRLSYHYFPRANKFFVYKKKESGEAEKIDRLEAWKIALDVDKFSASSKVCSLHFRKDDYFFPDIDAKRRCLKKNAVPSLFVPNDFAKSLVNYSQKQVQSDNQENIEYFENVEVNREIEFVPVKDAPPDEISDDEDEDRDFSIRIDHIYSLAASQEEYSWNKSTGSSIAKTFQNCAVHKLDKSVQVNETKDTHNVQNVAVQVDSSYLSPKILDFIDCDHDLITLTGIQSFEALRAVVESVRGECGEKYDRASSDMKTQDRVIMTCAKVKHNLSYSLLTIMFRNRFKKMCHSTCRQMFKDMLNILCKCLKNAARDELTFLTLRSLNLQNYKTDEKK